MSKTCAGCIRALMIFFNFLFILIGLAIVGLGIYLLVSGYVSSASGELSILAYPCIGLTILGIVPVFLAVCGCWGALRYNRCCLGMYFTFLLFVFAAEVATGIAGVVFKDEVRTHILRYLKKAVEDYEPTEKLTSLDLVQATFHCCGYKGPSDYGHKAFPKSCCGYAECDVSTLPGCEKRTNEIEKHTLILCAIIIGLAVIQATRWAGLLDDPLLRCQG
ncbi:Tetraspanin-33 [Echinococcus granulosus]|uniref:Tetraspanin-33 n=1 Tax=Echinococcus granulosus TaxID=6210 RepID=W6UYP7_ECHGR|nr:Tetraspanin-33 [Echinococcus granulosus]EUB63772.1 Tetraspanin-33 [Echinococcus granulosus]